MTSLVDRFRSHAAAEDVFEVGAPEGLDAWFAVPPRVAVRPRDPQQAADLLREAASLAIAVVPWGGGQHQEIGNVPRPADVLFSTLGLAGIVDYDAADQTITVRAGTRIADLVARLREDALMLPLDPPGVARATVGGVVAAAAAGPLRAGYGTPRDWVLGTLSAHSDGTVARSGGRLVKNVTGFDLHRLYCGSLGTLAVLCEISLRLKPVPESDATLAVAFRATEDLDEFLARARAAGDDAVSRVALDAGAIGRMNDLPDFGPDAGCAVMLRYHGLGLAVDRALERAQSAAIESLALEARRLGGAEAGALWVTLREARSNLDPSGRGALLKIAFLPFGDGTAGVAGGLLEALDAICLGAGARPAILLEPLPGLARVHLDEPPTEDLLADLRAFVARQGSARIAIEGGPLAWREQRDVYFGGVRNQPALRRLKQALDPGLVLSPGRMFGRGP